MAANGEENVARARALAESAEEKLAEMDAGGALKLVMQASELAGDDPVVLAVHGEVLLETGDVEAAIEALVASVAASESEGGHARYMYLGQLHAGSDALGYYAEGISQMVHLLEEGVGEEGEDALRREISNGYASMADIFLTDTCEDDNAEEEAVRLASLAVEADPSNYEALQTLASIRISQCMNDEAETLLDASADLWSGLDEEDAPPPDFQLSAAQLYIELGSYEKALTVLGSALRADAISPEAWFLAAICDINLEDFPSAAEHLLRARTLAHGLELNDDVFDAELEQRLEQTAAALVQAGDSLETYEQAAEEERAVIQATLEAAKELEAQIQQDLE